ncbi:MAG: SMI1/KNR4 family protein [Nostoc sp.]|uniref:SMI1/KNR4 family protein n=1 Tax=Nostoc sp. TaxID=1180 RepID=UPI002FF1D5D9
MSQLTDALDRILNWLQQNKPSYASSLQPGLTYEEIEEKVKNLPFRLPREVYELYQWRNGMIDDDSEFFSYYRFIPLEEALQLEKEISKNFGLSLPFGWFPIFDFENEGFAIIGAEENTESSPVLNTYLSDDIRYTNLTNMMQCIAECYEINAYYIDESGHLKQDNKLAKTILQKYEPELNYIGEARFEVINNPDGSQVMTKYHPDNIILETRIIDAKGNTKELSSYFQGKIFRRMTSSYKMEGFYSYIRDENWLNDHEINEKFEVEYQYKCVMTKIERRYINGVLKQETIYPDKPRDRTLLIFTFLIVPLIRVVSLLLVIFSLPKNHKQS